MGGNKYIQLPIVWLSTFHVPQSPLIRTMPGRLFPRSVIQDIFDSSCILQPPSDIHSSTFTSFESTTSLLYLPEVWTPAAQYLIDVGLRPSLAQRLSDTYVDFVARNRKLFESYFNCAISKGCHLSAECYRSTFIVQFKRTIQVWDSQFVSVVRVLSRQAGVPMVSFHPERVDASILEILRTTRNTESIIIQIRVDDAAKAEIIARLGIKATQLTSDRVRFNCFVSSQLTTNQAFLEGDKPWR